MSKFEMREIKGAEIWYQKLVSEIKQYEPNVAMDIIDYYKFANVCYAATEYIYKILGLEDKMKSKELDEQLNIKVKYIYDKEFKLNQLKHINSVRDEVLWATIFDMDIHNLAVKLCHNTMQLIEAFRIRKLLDPQLINKNYMDLYPDVFKQSAQLIDNIAELSRVILENQLTNTFDKLAHSIRGVSSLGNTPEISDSIKSIGNSLSSLALHSFSDALKDLPLSKHDSVVNDCDGE